MQKSSAISIIRIAVWSLTASILTLPPVLAQDTASDSVSGTLGLSCGFPGGTDTLNFSATLDASVTPYITNDRDGEFSAVVSVSTSRDTNCNFPAIPAVADPQVYFGGSSGSFGVGWSADNAFRGSSVRINRAGDQFLPGSYRVTGDDGAGSFSFSPSVSVAGVGLSISQSDGAPIVLFGNSSNPRIIEIGNVIWGLFQYRGNFRTGGNFALRDFRLRTGTDSEAEFGEIDVSIPVLKAREGVGVLTLTGQLVGTLSARLRYIRGNYLREPDIEIVPERSVIGTGDTVKVDVIIRNRSTIRLNGGQVILDTAPLAPTLFPSTGSLEFDDIPPNGSRTVSFELTGFTEGRAPIEVEVRGGWDSPVPQDREYTRALSVENGIQVSDSAVSAAALESPQPDSFESGIGLIRGWVCEAEMVEIQIDDGALLPVAYGTSREDTAGVCGRSDTGFGLTVNWNLLGDGTHTLRAFADGVEFGQATFTVTTLGEEFLRDVSGEFILEDFPDPGRDVAVRWSEPHQNFVISGDGQSSIIFRSLSAASRARQALPRNSSLAALESPQPDSFESGIGLIRGWVCEAEMVEIQIDDGALLPVAYGTSREDTAGVCGRSDTGFGLTVNWNLLGDGTHTLRAFADGVEFGQATFTVTTLGEEFLRDVSGEYDVMDFPETGRGVRLRWSEFHQNFVIMDELVSLPPPPAPLLP